jgi:predicted PurR-regulated permease PerM
MEHTRRDEARLAERLTRGAPLAVILVGVALVVYKLLPVLEVVALAMLLALILRTIVNGLKRIGLPNWLAVVALVVGVLAFLAFGWFVIIPRLLQEFRTLISRGPGSLEALSNFLSGLPFVPNPDALLQRLESFLTGLLGSLPQLAFTVLTVAGTLVAVLILSVYLAISPGTYIRGGLRLVPLRRRDMIEDFIQRLGVRLRGWLLGTVLVALFIGVGGGLGLWLLGLPLPLTFGIIAGLLNVIPFAGSVVGGALPALLALTVSPTKALLVVVLFTILNQIEGNILQPLIMGNEVPVAVILVSFLALGVLIGPIVGAILAVPSAVLAGVLVDELTERYASLGDEEKEGGSSEDSSDGSGKED